MIRNSQWNTLFINESECIKLIRIHTIEVLIVLDLILRLNSQILFKGFFSILRCCEIIKASFTERIKNVASKA